MEIHFDENEIQQVKSLIALLKSHNSTNSFEEIFGLLMNIRDHGNLTEEHQRHLINMASGFNNRAEIDFENSKGVIELLAQKFP